MNPRLEINYCMNGMRILHLYKITATRHILGLAFECKFESRAFYWMALCRKIYIYMYQSFVAYKRLVGLTILEVTFQPFFIWSHSFCLS